MLVQAKIVERAHHPPRINTVDSKLVLERVPLGLFAIFSACVISAGKDAHQMYFVASLPLGHVQKPPIPRLDESAAPTIDGG
jgi:hypothetical protein